MITKTIFCSACDREVKVRVHDETTLDGAVCTDIGFTCTGTLCPICAVPPDQIREQVKKLKED